MALKILPHLFWVLHPTSTAMWAPSRVPNDVKKVCLQEWS